MKGKDLLKMVEEGTWKGMKKWECTLCPFDSIESKDVVIDHILNVHLGKRRGADLPGTPVLVDKEGRPLLMAAPGVDIVPADDRKETANTHDETGDNS